MSLPSDLLDGARAAMMATRVETCFQMIRQATLQDRPMLDEGAYADRYAVLATLRIIKAKAIEAEILLRAIERPRIGANQS